MKKTFEKIYEDPFCFGGLALSLATLSLGCLFLLLFWSRLPPQIPLFYSQPWGEEQLGFKIQMLFLPVFAFLIFAFSLFSARQLLNKNIILARIIIGTGGILVLVLTVALFQIVNLVT